MADTKVAPYGSWRSPITSDLIVGSVVGLSQIALDGGDTYWVELRPREGGRIVLIRRAANGDTTDMTAPPFNVRTRVHEYGGGAFSVNGGVAYITNFVDQRLYRLDSGHEPHPMTPEAAMRYADGVIDARRSRMICVREDHTGGDEAANTLINLDLAKAGEARVLVSGNDFYSSPQLSPDGSRLAWLSWDHPNMPWDSSELWLAEVADDGSIRNKRLVAGGLEESIFQPQWSPDGVLYFVSDRTGWWNLYRWKGGQVEPLTEMEAEFGLPQWVFGMSTYAFESSERIICAVGQGGTWRLANLDIGSGRLEHVETAYTEIFNVRAAPGLAVFLGGSATEPLSVVRLDLATMRTEVLRRSNETDVDPGYLSAPEHVEFPTNGGLTAHGFFYRPQNRDCVAPSEELPPLLVKSHGGPTGSTSTALNLGIQYWTSRGIAVLDVNYGGSTGYGRAYRQRLDGRWGIVDVDDCTNGALYLLERGDVDENRLAITGGSAGGYTTLCALTFRDVFGAGTSHFGVSDLKALTEETHKFESRYLDRLIGPYPERRDLYVERSPIHFTDRISCPVAFFQGLEDKVVPPSQAELMVEALRKKGTPVAYVPFEGEQHGFRRAENIKRALDGELYFYSRVFGIDLAEPVEPVPIENL